MGFAKVYENIITYLLETPDSGQNEDYQQLVRRNKETFDTLYRCIQQKVSELLSDTTQMEGCTGTDDGGTGLSQGTTVPDPIDLSDSCNIRLVEPRELLNLLNYIETNCTRLMFAPRPFYRSNVFCLTSLVQMEETLLLACFVCGKHSRYSRTDSSLCFTTASMVRHLKDNGATTSEPNTNSDNPYQTYSVDASAIGGVLFNNDTEPHDRTVCITPVFHEVKHLHHDYCPVMWLHHDGNILWSFKNAFYTIRGVSKFNHILQFLTLYPRPRDNASWLCLVNRISRCTSPGANQQTLESLLRILSHERLVVYSGRTAWTSMPAMTYRYDQESVVIPKFYSRPVHVNAFIHDIENVADRTEEYGVTSLYQLADVYPGSSLPFGGSYTIVPANEEHIVANHGNKLKPYQTTDRPFNLQTEYKDGCSAEVAFTALQDGTVSTLHYYRLLYLHGYLVSSLEGCGLHSPSTNDSTVDHVCLFCGALFQRYLQSYKNSNVYYTAYQVDRLIKYALYGAKYTAKKHRYVYGRRLDRVSKFQATFPHDLNSRVLPKRLKKCHQADVRVKQALLWFSASLDVLHTDDCIFRIKKRTFDNTRCCICLDDDPTGGRLAMVCGHEYCKSCYNEIAMTDCCLCKRGYRTCHLTVTESVYKGYAINGLS